MTQFQNLQFKRGSKSANDSLIGPRGSISIDMETRSIRIHDGVTPGGVFEVKQGAAINAESLEFTTATEPQQVAGSGQTVVTFSVIELSNPAAVVVKVNGSVVTNYTIMGANQIEFDAPLPTGATIDAANVLTLDMLVSQAVAGEGGAVDQAVSDALASATSIGGILLSSFLTTNDLGSIVTVDDRIDCGIIN